MNFKTLLINFLVAIFGGIVAILGYSYLTDAPPTAPITNNESQTAEITARLVSQLSGESASPENFVIAAQSSLDAVVHVKTKLKGTGGQIDNSFFEFFLGEEYKMNPSPVIGSGSGVIISHDGYIVTNNHVVSESNLIEVTLNDQRSFEAKVIGVDDATDIALLKIHAENLPTIKYGNSDNLRVGEWVLAVGNPFNLTSTVTAGIVSAKGRDINILQGNYAVESFIQTDAAVNPGNSGGALVNPLGELVGINTAIASRTGSFSGYSFAIPVNIVKKVVDDLIEFGIVQRALLGISIRNVDAQLAKEKKLSEIKGVYVISTMEDGAARESGIKNEDIITQIEQIAVNKVTELQEQISKYSPGDQIQVTVIRKGSLMVIPVILKNKKGTTAAINSGNIDALGAKFDEISAAELRRLGIKGGIQVIELQPGKLLKAGVKEGFIITKLNNEAIRSFSEIKKTIEKTRGGVYIEGIYPDGSTAYYAFGIN